MIAWLERLGLADEFPLMEVLKELGAGSAQFAFVDDERKKKAQAAYDKGIDCILKCQITVNGKLTGW